MRDHVQEAIMEVAEFMVPRRSQRFRKRDRFAFHGKKLMRKGRYLCDVHKSFRDFLCHCGHCTRRLNPRT